MLNGKSIELTGTVAYENKQNAKKEQDAYEKAKLDMEIYKILKERRRPAGNIGEGDDHVHSV